MTAQKLTASTSTDSHKAFRQALQLKSSSEQPYSRKTTGPMPIPQQQAKHNHHHHQQAADAIQAERPQAWGVANSAKPDSQQEKAREQQKQQPAPKRHQHLTVVTDTDADASMPPAGAEAEVDATASGGGGGGAAIPMSPPSSPSHVVAAHSQDQLVVTTPTPAADASTKPMDVDLPPVVSPPPTSTAAPQGAVVVAVAVAVADGAATTAPVAAPAAPIRLGRGRKLCPNCKALTKSAVKKCRECKHVFNPVSQRLRAQLREPKENEEAPMLPRRRHRPSQRLLESLVEPEDPSHAATGAGEGGGRSPSAPARRPRSGSASNSRGNGNQRGVVSTPPAAGASKEQQQQQQQQQHAPKRSHKRKNPLPPGVAPSKRKKGAAAAARLAAAAAQADPDLAAGGAAASTAARGVLPILTLPEQQRVAHDLLASPTPSRHTVPESPELVPVASPAGPLLFVASSAASNLSSGPLEDDSGWLSRSGSVGGGGGGGASVGGVGSVSPTTAFVEQQLQLQQQQQQQQQMQMQMQMQTFAAASVAVTSLPGLLLDDDDDEDEMGRQQQHVLPVRRQDGGGGMPTPDLSAEGQERDPFADVEMWWEGDRAAAVNNPTVTAGGPPAFPMVSRDGTTQQRVVFPQSTSTSINMELLGDMDDAILWNPLRASSSGGPAATAVAGVTGRATAAGRTLTLWPGSSNNDNHLLLSAPSSSTSSSSNFRGNHRRSPSPENDVVYPDFECGAAIASAVGIPPATPTTSSTGGGGGSNAPGLHGHRGRADFLLAEASCSSLPEPLVFAGNGPAVAAVSADSCSDGTGDGTEGGGFWNPLFPVGGLGSSYIGRG